MNKAVRTLLLTAAAAAVAAPVLLYLTAGDTAKLAESDGMGASPVLPEANPPLVPTVKVAPVKRWADGAMPDPAHGLAVKAFATGLDHPRWLHVLPNGDVLVAESNAPPRPEDSAGLKGWIAGLVMQRAGAGVASANRISLLRDADGDGVAEVRKEFISGLNSPFGMALIGADLYVANTGAVLDFPYTAGADTITAPGVKVADLPGGPLNHHWTKGLLASLDGKRLYASVGSNSNIAENGIEREDGRAAIVEIDLAEGKSRVFASGLRNPVGMAWHPTTGELWTVVNERDELGSDLVPDYLTSVKDGAFYGWPYSYYGQHVDTRVSPQKPEIVAKAVKPDYALGNHVAPLGLAFAEGTAMPEAFRRGAFVGEHGSWNRDPASGYKVVFVSFEGGKPTGKPVDVLAGFLDADGNARGRPVGVAIDRSGALLVADDVGNVVWRVTAVAVKSADNQ
ncbi:MAG: PQQ-dependent sugar dehydrogenase [Aestuariivirga sp.]